MGKTGCLAKFQFRCVGPQRTKKGLTSINVLPCQPPMTVKEAREKGGKNDQSLPPLGWSNLRRDDVEPELKRIQH